MNDGLIVIKPNDTHLSFIFATWLSSFKYASYFARMIRKTVYYSGHHPLLKNTLNREDVLTLLCCSENDPNIIVGFIVCEPSKNIVHFLYTKETFRRLGVARMLFNKAELNIQKLIFTHWTNDVNWMMDRIIKKNGDKEVIFGKFRTMIYNPYLFFNPELFEEFSKSIEHLAVPTKEHSQ